MALAFRPPAAFAFAILQTQSDRGCAASGMTTLLFRSRTATNS
jgi:hypothetical protein